MVTHNEILTNVYEKVLISPIVPYINGDVYKKTRPADSKLQDCVISVISGVIGKFIQDGALQIKLFYLDVDLGDTIVEDTATSSDMETLLFDFSDFLMSDTRWISYEISSREIYTARVEEISQHYAILKLNYKIN